MCVLQPNQWKVDREKGLLGVASCRMARIARTRGIGRDATGRHMHPPTRRPEGKVVGLYSGSDAIRCACGVDTHVLKWTTRRRDADLTCRAAQYSHRPFRMQSRTPLLYFSSERERESSTVLCLICAESCMQFGFFPEERNCDRQLASICVSVAARRRIDRRSGEAAVPAIAGLGSSCHVHASAVFRQLRRYSWQKKQRATQ